VLWHVCKGGHHATAMLLLALCGDAHLWYASIGGWSPLALCMVTNALTDAATVAAGKTTIAKALLATPGFMALPLHRGLKAVAMATKYPYERTPAHPLVRRAIREEVSWHRRAPLLLLRVLADKDRAIWRCRCTDCHWRRQGRGRGKAAALRGVAGVTGRTQHMSVCTATVSASAD